MSLVEYERPKSDCEPLSFERALGPTTGIPWTKKSSSIEVQPEVCGTGSSSLCSTFGPRFSMGGSGESCSTLSGSLSLSLSRSLSFSFSLSPLPNLNPAPRPSGMPDRLGHSCPALRKINHGYLEGTRKKDMTYTTTRWYPCSELLGKCGRPVEGCVSSTGEVYVGTWPKSSCKSPWAMCTRKYSTKCVVHKAKGINVYLWERFVHVPGYDSDFEEAMVQWSCLWMGRG